MHTLALSQFRSKINRRGAYENIRTALLAVGISIAIPFFAPITAQAVPVTFFATLGDFENPPTDSPGTGSATVIMDIAAHTLSIDMTSQVFWVLRPPRISIVVLTYRREMPEWRRKPPRLLVFPSAYRQNYSDLFDTLAPPPSCGFYHGYGGTPASAETALFAGLLAGEAYFNIHTSRFRGGEIRGFLRNANPRRAPAVRHRTWRTRSADVAQEAEGSRCRILFCWEALTASEAA